MILCSETWKPGHCVSQLCGPDVLHSPSIRIFFGSEDAKTTVAVRQVALCTFAFACCCRTCSTGKPTKQNISLNLARCAGDSRLCQPYYANDCWECTTLGVPVACPHIEYICDPGSDLVDELHSRQYARRPPAGQSI